MSAQTSAALSGGCQCGAVRFRAEGLGRAAICHCRMCQKAFGNAFAPFVTGKGVTWTRGEPKWFQSSDRVRRGFCTECGTPLSYRFDGGPVELAICAFDDPGAIAPVIQFRAEQGVAWSATVPGLPTRTPEEAAQAARVFDGLVSYQHPDHDTETWPPAGGAPEGQQK